MYRQSRVTLPHDKGTTKPPVGPEDALFALPFCYVYSLNNNYYVFTTHKKEGGAQIMINQSVGDTRISKDQVLRFACWSCTPL